MSRRHQNGSTEPHQGTRHPAPRLVFPANGQLGNFNFGGASVFSGSSTAGSTTSPLTSTSGVSVLMNEEEESWSRTTWSSIKGRHIWLVEDFLAVLKRPGSDKVMLTSAVFTARNAGGGGGSFNFQMRLLTKVDVYNEWVGLELVNLNAATPERCLDVQVDFILKSKEDREELFKQLRKPNVFIRSESKHVAAERFSPSLYGEVKQFPNAFKKSDLIQHADTFMPDGALTLVCNVKVIIPDTRSIAPPERPLTGPLSVKTKEPSITRDLIKLYEEAVRAGSDDDEAAAFCDFVFICDGHKLPCHRAILAARSPVFRAMLTASSDTAEVRQGKAEVTDATPAAMAKLLEFIYTDKVDDLGQSTCELSEVFAAADKYGLDELRSLAERALAACLNTDDAAEILILAYLHEAKWLKSRVMDYVRENMSSVAETSGWKGILSSHPQIMHELLVKEFGGKKKSC